MQRVDSYETETTSLFENQQPKGTMFSTQLLDLVTPSEGTHKLKQNLHQHAGCVSYVEQLPVVNVNRRVLPHMVYMLE